MLVNCIGDNAEQGSVTILVKCIGGDARQGVVDKVGHGSVDNARQDNTNNACQRIGDNAKHDRLHQTMLDSVVENYEEDTVANVKQNDQWKCYKMFISQDKKCSVDNAK